MTHHTPFHSLKDGLQLNGLPHEADAPFRVALLAQGGPSVCPELHPASCHVTSHDITLLTCGAQT